MNLFSDLSKNRSQLEDAVYLHSPHKNQNIIDEALNTDKFQSYIDKMSRVGNQEKNQLQNLIASYRRAENIYLARLKTNVSKNSNVSEKYKNKTGFEILSSIVREGVDVLMASEDDIDIDTLNQTERFIIELFTNAFKDIQPGSLASTLSVLAKTAKGRDTLKKMSQSLLSVLDQMRQAQADPRYASSQELFRLGYKNVSGWIKTINRYIQNPKSVQSGTRVKNIDGVAELSKILGEISISGSSLNLGKIKLRNDYSANRIILSMKNSIIPDAKRGTKMEDSVEKMLNSITSPPIVLQTGAQKSSRGTKSGGTIKQDIRFMSGQEPSMIDFSYSINDGDKIRTSGGISVKLHEARGSIKFHSSQNYRNFSQLLSSYSLTKFGNNKEDNLGQIMRDNSFQYYFLNSLRSNSSGESFISAFKMALSRLGPLWIGLVPDQIDMGDGYFDKQGAQNQLNLFIIINNQVYRTSDVLQSILQEFARFTPLLEFRDKSGVFSSFDNAKREKIRNKQLYPYENGYYGDEFVKAVGADSQNLLSKVQFTINFSGRII